MNAIEVAIYRRLTAEGRKTRGESGEQKYIVGSMGKAVVGSLETKSSTEAKAFLNLSMQD